MRKQKKVLVISLLLALLVLSACGSGTASQTNETGEAPRQETKAIELDFQTPLPPTSKAVVNAFEPWAKMVEEKTEGRVKINLYTSSTLGSIATVFDDIASGVYDIIPMSMPHYNMDTDWYQLSIGSMPLAFKDPEEAARVMSKYFDKYGQAAYGDNVKYFSGGQICTDPYMIFSTVPIETYDDLKGKKLRLTGNILAPMVEEWGAVPTSLGSDEMVEALDRGAIDGTIYSSDLEVSMKEVLKYAVGISKGINVYCGSPAMNQAAFDSLPEDIQQLFEEELMPMLGQMNNEEYIRTTSESKQLFEGELQINQFSAEDEQRLFSSAKVVWDKWVKDANDKGYPGDQMMADFKQFMAEEGLELPF